MYSCPQSNCSFARYLAGGRHFGQCLTAFILLPLSRLVGVLEGTSPAVPSQSVNSGVEITLCISRNFLDLVASSRLPLTVTRDMNMEQLQP